MGGLTMRIKPNRSYKLLGTTMKLDSRRIYPASHATNQPDWKARGAIFVFPGENFDSMLLVDGEYTITKEVCK